MKTSPEHRHFALPVVIVASAHAFLFFGFVAPPKIPSTPAVKVNTEVVDFPFTVPDDPLVSNNPEDHDSSRTESRAGQPLPDLPETPILDNLPNFTVPIEHAQIHSVNTPIAGIPAGPIGDSATTHHQGILSATDLDFIPRTISQLAPVYPASLRVAGISGRVTVSFIVDTHGRVSNVQVLSATHSDFIEPALRAVSCWKFQPGKREGRTVSFRMSIPLNFVLDAE